MIFSNSCQDIYSDHFALTDNKIANHLTFLSINVRGLSGKFGALLSLINEFATKFLFICLTEIWLDASDTGFLIPNYNKYSIYRNANGGGIAVFVRNDITVETIANKSGIFPTHESLCLQCQVPGFGELFLWTVYRPPHLSKVGFIEYLESSLAFSRNSKVCLTGDFNFNLLNLNDRYVALLKNAMSSFDFCCNIDKPTYFCSTKKKPTSCLDHYWHNFKNSIDYFIIYPPFSDHMAVIMCVYCNSTSEFKTITFRDFSLANKTNFLENLENECSSFQLCSTDINSEITRFLQWFEQLTNKYFPIKKKTVSWRRACAPWITTNIKKCIAKKHTWFKLFKAKIITYNSFKNYCNRLNYLLKCAESRYYNKRFGKLKSNPKKNWNLLKDLLGVTRKSECKKLIVNGVHYTDPKVISDLFAEHFARAAQFPANGNLNGLDHIASHNRSFYFFYPTPSELSKAIMKLKNTSSDKNVSTKVLKLGNRSFSSILCDLLYLCIGEGKYPDQLKLARVVPIHKKGCKQTLSNYRPISILTNVNKIFESIIYSRIYSFLEKYNLFSPNQYGFRQGLSTKIACLRLVSLVLPAFIDKQYAAVLFLDFSKAFDTVQHDILLKKFERLGLRGLPLQLVKSYLHNRMYYVSINNCNSTLHTIAKGVPQGSANGPLFFSVYINDLPDFLGNMCKNILYADDTTVIFVGDEMASIEQSLNTCIQKISQWCSFNGLSLNAEKSKAMIFSNREYNAPNIILEGRLIDVETESFKYLGTFFDPKLKFNDHIMVLCNKLSTYCGISYRLRYKLNLHTARSYYFAYFYSTLSYCIAAWGGLLLCSHRGDRLLKLQDRLVRNLFSKFFPHSSINDLYKELNLLKVPEIYKYRLATLMYRMFKCNSFPELLSFINPTLPSHNHDTRQTSNFLLPLPRTQCIRESFSYQALVIWNELNDDIKNASTYKSFKKLCHDYYLNKY